MKDNLSYLEILGCRVHLLSKQEVLGFIKQALNPSQTLQVVTANPEMLLLAQKDEILKKIINSSELVVPDGEGLVWALKRKVAKNLGRITGIDLAEALFKIGAELSWRFFLLGGQPGVAEKARQNLLKIYPGLKIVGTYHGYFNEAETSQIVEKISQSQPDLLFVGLGMGKQEKFIFENLNRLGARIALGIGGAMDVWSGRLKRSPGIFRKLKIEWLFRFIQEPRRFRKLLSLIRFIFLTYIK